MNAEFDTMTRNSYTLDISIGGIVCRLVCREKRLYKNLVRVYRDFRSGRGPDITVEMELVDVFPREAVAAASADGTVIKAGPDIAGLYRPGETPGDGNSFRLDMLKHNFTAGVKFMNLVLPPAYYTATSDDTGRRSMLVHSCGIRRPAGVLLFCGPSETGKTTVARFYRSDKGAVLNDEMLLLSLPDQPGGAVPAGGPSLSGGPVMAGGTPIIGGIREKSNATAPLAAIINLKQSDRTIFREIGRRDAYLRFMRQVIASRTFRPELNDTRALLEANADFSHAVLAATPCYEMEFTLDKKLFRKTIAQLEAEVISREETRSL